MYSNMIAVNEFSVYNTEQINNFSSNGLIDIDSILKMIQTITNTNVKKQFIIKYSTSGFADEVNGETNTVFPHRLITT